MINDNMNSNMKGNIEYYLLDLKTGVNDVKRLCEQAIKNRAGSICIVPWLVSYAADLLRGKKIEICTRIGIPTDDCYATCAKGAEAREAVRNGAAALDIFVSRETIKSADLQKARNDIEETIAMTHYGNPIKRIILEFGMYTKEERKSICELAKVCKVDGISIDGEGIKPEDIIEIRSNVGKEMEIKVSGGTADSSLNEKLVGAGANCIAINASIA